MTVPADQERTSPAARLSFGLAIVGLLLSAYLSFERLTGSTTLACSDSGTVNCLAVTTSAWSAIAGVPVAMLGLAYFVAMTVLCAPIRSGWDLTTARVVGAVAGCAMVVWLVYVELFKVNAICLWCTAVHVVTVLLLGAVLWWRESDRAHEDRARDMTPEVG